jgi:fructosamine-3-kinase
VGGGSINSSFRIATDRGSVFIKVGDRTALDMYEAEAAGLAELEHAAAVRVPGVIEVGAAENLAYLLLDWIALTEKSAAIETQLGGELAQQHRVSSDRFGWHRDNTIGATPQVNTPSDNWLEFYREQRVRYQLNLAVANGLPQRTVDSAQRALEQMEKFFDDYQPVPSLLHGDLWSGNWGADKNGIPYIFDPAVYFGDREADLAMTRLFGGFGREFYAAYASEWPLAYGWERREDLYNLYHLLNHFNLFGSAYLDQVDATIQRLLDATT